MRPTSLWLRIPESKVYQMSYAAVPLIISGVIVQSADDRFRDMRNNYLPRVRFHTDDYLQYAPAALMLGLKAAGLPGRSSWGRMLVSDAFSTGIMAITINSLKYTCRVMRPDGSSRNSFPSGHTATAFMTATMLHKEYGLTHSPWYSIGGYAVATLTGLMRIANNKHYLSDVMVGAGVGILSAELGYWLADLIFTKRGMVSPEHMEPPFSVAYRPSFFGHRRSARCLSSAGPFSNSFFNRQLHRRRRSLVLECSLGCGRSTSAFLLAVDLERACL